jgi:hypothetical protein
VFPYPVYQKKVACLVDFISFFYPPAEKLLFPEQFIGTIVLQREKDLDF